MKDFTFEHGVWFEVTPDGLFYSPEKNQSRGKYGRKHHCPDCFFCQWCADLRCSECRRDLKDCDRAPLPGDGRS